MLGNNMGKIEKLLFIGTYPPPYGGIASHLLELLPQLIKCGYSVISLTPSSDNKIIVSARMKNIFFNLKKSLFKNVFILHNYIFNIKYQKDLGFRELLKTIAFAHTVNEIIRKERIDAVFIYTIDNGIIIPVLKRMIRKRCPPIILMIFGAFYLWPNKYKNKIGYIKEIFSNCDLILSSSKYCAASISTVLGFDYPVEVVYVGVDESTYIPNKSGQHIRKLLQIPDDATVLLFLGRMTKEMGLDFLLRTSTKILDINRHNYLILAGAEGSLSSQAKKLSTSEQRVRYCPNISSLDKPAYYDACDILIAPSAENYACMGVSIKEAMSSEKPIIASNSGGIPEAVEDGVNGFLIPVVDGELDENIFMDRLLRLMDDKLRIKMGENGRKIIFDKFTNDQTAKKYINLIEKLERPEIEK